jgi:hypothetical protein
MRPPSATTVRWVVLGTIVLTLFHFTDNAVNVDTYPKAGWQPDWFAAVVVAGGFLYTAVALIGLRLYRQERFRAAHVALVIYGLQVLSSLLHFAYGSPSELTTRGVVSVFVDAAAGSLVIAVALWSIMARGSRLPRTEPRASER